MAIQAFQRAYARPDEEAAHATFATRRGQYATLWAYYTNEAFESLATWQSYRARHRLYRNHRSLYNPTQRLVDFYAGHVYPGIVTVTPDRYGGRAGQPEGARLAFPLADDTSAPLRAALGQLFQWGNWQQQKGILVRWGAALGDVLVEVVDDLEREKVYPQLVWPGQVADLTIDATGNVKGYRLEYDATDADGRSYVYSKQVDGDGFTILRDGRTVQSWANPYGFVPAVWCKHSDQGGQHGAPALRSLGKVDELNGLVSQAHDNLRKQMGAPLLIKTNGSLLPFGGDAAKRAGTAEAQGLGRDEAELLNIWTVAGDAGIMTVPLDPAAVLAWVDKLLGEIEHDHPEVTFYQQLRSMGEVSGVAASRLMGDVEGYVADAQAGYDQQIIKLLQMSVAVAGWRVNDGAWGRLTGALTRQQEVFRPFGLESYAAGDLDFTLLPRPLVPLSERERLEIERERQSLESDRLSAQEARGLAASVADRLRAGATGNGASGAPTGNPALQPAPQAA